MNSEPMGTAPVILATARELFAQRGYDGTSVRAITTRAGVNLGSITYHFGSKAELYAAVIASVVTPLRDRVLAVAAREGDALYQLAEVVAVYMDHFAHAPDMPKLIMQEVFTERPLTAALRGAMASILGAITEIIRRGQSTGRVRTGTPVLMALSLLSQPIYFNLVRGPLAQTGILDLGDPARRREMVAHITRFALAGLMPLPGDPE